MGNFYKRRKPFTQISNEFVQSNKISSKAKIVMNVMQSLPDSWKYSVNGLRGYFKEGKNFIRTGIIELEELGYLVRIQLQKEQGKFGQNIYIMDDEVVTVDYIVEVLIENEITSYKKIYELLTDRGFNTTIEEICAILEQNGIEVDLNDVNTSFSPLSTFPSTVNPMTENSTLINNIKTNIKSSQSKSNCKLTQENENNSQKDLLDILNARLRDGKIPNDPVPYMISMLFNVVEEHDVTAFIRAAPDIDQDHSFDLNEYKALVNSFD